MPRKSLMFDAPTPTRELRTRKPAGLSAPEQTTSPKDKAALQPQFIQDREPSFETFQQSDENSQTRGRRPTRTAAKQASDKIKTNSQARSLSRGVSVDTVASQTGSGLPRNVPMSAPNSSRRSVRTAAKKLDQFAGSLPSEPLQSAGAYDEDEFRQCWNQSRLEAERLSCFLLDDTRAKRSTVLVFKLSPRNPASTA